MSAKFPVTIFPDKRAFSVESELWLSLDELGDLIESRSAPCKDELPWLKLARFGNQRSTHNSLRHNDNVELVGGAECDYDNKALSYELAVARVRERGVSAIIYTSASYTPELPKWRALFPFSREYQPADRARFLDRANALFDGQLAPESWVLSQGYYFGKVNDAFRMEVIHGTPIDLLEEAAEEPKVSPKIDGLPAKLLKDIISGDAKRFGGDRSRVVWAVACGLARCDFRVAEIENILLNGGYGVNQHVKEQGDPVRYARKQAEDAIEAVGRERDDIVATVQALNAEYAVVANAGKVAILREYDDSEGLSTFALMSTGAFGVWLANRPTVGEEPLTSFWLRHLDRRQYNGIVFAPAMERPGWYNLWRGFAIEPKAGDCSLFLAHLHDNVAQGDEKLYRWVVGWLADIVQHPGRKLGTSLALMGKMGVGKTIVGKTMGVLLGRHYMIVARPRLITGQFNAHLLSCLMLHADEGFWAGDKSAEGVLKDLVTGESHFIEMKGQDVIPVRNYIRLLVTSNEDWVVPAGMEERRFAVLPVGEAHIQDKPYFKAIEDQLKAGGYEALLDHLLNFDLTTVDIGVIPVTEELLSQKLESLDPVKSWWLTMLHDGKLPYGCTTKNTCPASSLYESYIAHSKQTSTRHRAAMTQFGMALRKLMPLSRAGKPDLFRAKGHCDTGRDGGTKIGWTYTLPSLSACRRRFEELCGQSLLWNGDIPMADGVESAELFEGDEPWETEELPAFSPTYE